MRCWRPDPRWLVAVALCLAGPAAAAPDGTLTRVALARGGTLLVLEDQRVPLVEMVFAVPRGWVHRSWDLEEELAWKYQLLDTRIDVYEKLDLLPADLSLTIGPDQVMLRATCLARDAEGLASLLAVALNSDFRGISVDLTEEAAFTHQERQQRPIYRLDTALRDALLVDGDSRRADGPPPLDLVVAADDLRQRRDTLVRRPERVIGFAGAIDLETARRLANRMLVPANTRSGELPGPATRPPRPDGPDRELVAQLDGIQATWIGLARIGLASDDPALAATSLAEAVARDRVMDRIRADLGATYSVSSQGLVGRHPDVYQLMLSTAPDQADAVLRELREILTDLAAGGITQDELDRVRQREFARLELAHQSPGQLLLGSITRELHGERVRTLGDWQAQLAAVELDAVHAAAAQFFRPEAFATAVLTPGE